MLVAVVVIVDGEMNIESGTVLLGCSYPLKLSVHRINESKLIDGSIKDIELFDQCQIQ